MSAHKLTRRQFVARGGTAVGAITLGGALAPVAAGARRGTASAPARTIVLGMETIPPGFDPHKWWNGAGFQAVDNVFDGLVGLDVNTSKIVPKLAAAMPHVTADGKTYTFKLRTGVTFHDGSPLTAADVKYSFERLLSPKQACEAAGLYTGLPIIGIEKYLAGKTNSLPGIKVVDPHTVVFQFEAPDSAFIPSITYAPASIVPKAVVERVGAKKFNWAPVGSGPFRVTSASPQHGVRMARHPHYWDPGIPKADAVIWNFNVDPQLSVLRILKGEQDLMYEPVPGGSLDQIRNDPSKKHLLEMTPENELWWISMSEKVPALKNLNVRKAIAMAIDKQKLHRVLKGVGSPATGGIFSPLSPYYQANLAPQYDPKAAKQLLVKAGYGSGLTLKAWSANFFPWAEMAQSVQQDLKAIGITLDYKAMTYNQFTEYTNTAPAGLVFFNWGLSYPHGSYIIDAGFTKAAVAAGCCNYAHWVDPRVERLAVAARRTPSQQKSISIYKQIDRIITQEQAVWVPLIYAARPDLHSARLKGWASLHGGTDEPKILYTFSV